MQRQGRTPLTTENGAAVEESATENPPSHGFTCCKDAGELSRQPIPDLDEALDFMLENVSCFAEDSQELKSLRQAVVNFRAPDSVSRKVYDRLAKQANDPTVENWLHDQVAQAWLKRRDPVQFTNSTATHYDAKIGHTQAERAALIATAAFRHKQAADAGTLEPDLLGVRTCTYFWDRLYNTCRRPQVGMDTVEKHSGDYFVVLRYGRVFKVPMVEGSEPIAFGTMKSIIETILEEVEGGESWVGILTSDVRDSWAKVRSEILSRGEEDWLTCSAETSRATRRGSHERGVLGRDRRRGIRSVAG